MAAPDFPYPPAQVSEAVSLVRMILSQNNVACEEIALSGFQFFQLAGQRGIIAAAQCGTNNYLAASMPILAQPYRGKFLTQAELMETLLNVGDISDSQFSISEQAVMLVICQNTPELSGNQAAHAIQRLFTTIRRVRAQMISSLEYLYPVTAANKQVSPFEILPNIALLPKQMESILQMLVKCPPHTQLIFRKLMEEWSRMGESISVADAAIHLDGSIGKKRIHLATLLPPGKGELAIIRFPWDQLRRRTSLNLHQLEDFQAQVRAISSLRETGIQAVMRVRQSLTLEKVEALLVALHKLSLEIHTAQYLHEKKANPQVAVRVQAFIEQMQPEYKALLTPLITAWVNEEGSIRFEQAGTLSFIMRSSHKQVGETQIKPTEVSLLKIKAGSENKPPILKITLLNQQGQNKPFFYIPAALQKFQTEISSFTQHYPIQRGAILIPCDQLTHAQMNSLQHACCDLLHAERLAGLT